MRPSDDYLSEQSMRPSDDYLSEQSGGGTGFNPVGSIYSIDREWAAPPPVFDKETNELVQYAGSRKARPSVFNRYSIFFFNNKESGASSPEDYYDDPSRHPGGSLADREQSVVDNPTPAQLIRWSKSGSTNAVEFDWPDFLWCTDLGAVPNNYMITLRRFPTPCADDLFDRSKNPSPDVGRLVSWVDGEVNTWESVGLKWSHWMSWREFTSKIQEISYESTGSFSNEGKGLKHQGWEASGAALQAFSAGTQDKLGKKFLGNPAMDNFNPYEDPNTVYGPVDIIKQMMVRDAGLNFTQEISLKFGFELRSIDGINPKAAFMDLLSNVLVCTANRGAFWGGEVHHYGGYARKIKPLGDPYKLQGGDISGYFKSLLSGLMGRLTSLTDGAGFSMAGLSNASKTIGSNLLGNWLGGALDGMGRPGIVAINALLTGEDTGEWHLTVGNPTNPIMSIGNLVLENTDVSFDGPLGADDFPTKLTVTCTLKPARPRDRTDIISMFHRNGRTYLTEPPQANNYAANLEKGGQGVRAKFRSGTDAQTNFNQNTVKLVRDPSTMGRFPNHAGNDALLLNAAKNIR